MAKAILAGIVMLVPRPKYMRLVMTGGALMFFGRNTVRGGVARPEFVLPRAGLMCTDPKWSGFYWRFDVRYAHESKGLRLTFSPGKRRVAGEIVASLRGAGGPVGLATEVGAPSAPRVPGVPAMPPNPFQP
jgi:hypothetical protein